MGFIFSGLCIGWGIAFLLAGTKHPNDFLDLSKTSGEFIIAGAIFYLASKIP